MEILRKTTKVQWTYKEYKLTRWIEIFCTEASNARGSPHSSELLGRSWTEPFPRSESLRLRTTWPWNLGVRKMKSFCVSTHCLCKTRPCCKFPGEGKEWRRCYGLWPATVAMATAALHSHAVLSAQHLRIYTHRSLTSDFISCPQSGPTTPSSVAPFWPSVLRCSLLRKLRNKTHASLQTELATRIRAT